MKMLKTVAAVGALTFVGFANASGNSSYLRASVPFGFVV